jgi:hypothetical protein
VARVNLAQRDLRNTTLYAPFDGFISSRSIDPFVEVRAGQKLFQIDAEGGFEAAFGVPETTIARVVLGMPATVQFPQVDGPLDALVAEVGSAAGTGNTFPLKAALIEPPPVVRRTLVKAAQALTGNVVAVTGVRAGDVVATAGVNFLVDGQNVTLMAPAAGG